MFVHILSIAFRKKKSGGAFGQAKLVKGGGGLLTILSVRSLVEPVERKRTAMTVRALLSLALVLSVTSIFSTRSAAAAEKDDGPLALLAESPPDGTKIATKLAETFLNDAQFKQEVKKLRERYEDWEKDTQGDMARYLNDRLIIVALGAANGKIDKIQRGILWLAFYKEFEQEQPGIVAKFMREHQGTLSKLFTDFTWEKASQYIKNKEWRKDYEEQRKKAEVELSNEPATAAND